MFFFHRVVVSRKPPLHSSSNLKSRLRWRAEEFLECLRQSRVFLSTESSTFLIEWERPEECDSHSIIRGIVGKSGVVLRRPPLPAT